MFVIGKEYKITYTTNLGDSEHELLAEVVDFAHPILKVKSEVFGEKVFNTASPAFILAERMD